MIKRKKILYLITQSENGGASKYVLDLVDTFKEEADITVAFGEQGELGELAGKLKGMNVEYFAIPHLKRSISLRDDIRALGNTFKLIRKVKPDIIHLNSSKISIIGSLAAFFARLTFVKTHVVYTAHGWVFNEPLSPGLKTFYRVAEKYTAVFKTKIICVSGFDYDIARKMRIAPVKKLVTVHNGIKVPEFYGREHAREELEKLVPSLSQASGFIIGSIGNLYKTKGFEYLIDAVKLLRDNGMNMSVVIIGDGPEKSGLSDWISQNKIQKDVFLAGRVDDAARLLPAFDIYACSSVKEGLSYTLLEAMLAGLPIVATNVGGNPEMIKDDETGILVKPQSPDRMAEAIIRLFNDKDSRARLSANASKLARKDFGYKQMIDKTREAYGL